MINPDDVIRMIAHEVLSGGDPVTLASLDPDPALLQHVIAGLAALIVRTGGDDATDVLAERLDDDTLPQAVVQAASAVLLTAAHAKQPLGVGESEAVHQQWQKIAPRDVDELRAMAYALQRLLRSLADGVPDIAEELRNIINGSDGE
ncbi:MAG: hypothetical protein K6T37_07800 [Acidothermus cellulolyticus]|nr:hypothetical protein [Acidothermus cellulolyticus]